MSRTEEEPPCANVCLEPEGISRHDVTPSQVETVMDEWNSHSDASSWRINEQKGLIKISLLWGPTAEPLNPKWRQHRLLPGCFTSPRRPACGSWTVALRTVFPAAIQIILGSERICNWPEFYSKQRLWSISHGYCFIPGSVFGTVDLREHIYYFISAADSKHLFLSSFEMWFDQTPWRNLWQQETIKH